MKKLAAYVLSAALAATPLMAQTASQDAKSAGHETKAAAKDTGHAVTKGTEKTYDKSKTGTKKAYHKTAHVTKKTGSEVGDKTEDAYGATKRGTTKAAKTTAHGTEKAYDKTKSALTPDKK